MMGTSMRSLSKILTMSVGEANERAMKNWPERRTRPQQHSDPIWPLNDAGYMDSNL